MRIYLHLMGVFSQPTSLAATSQRRRRPWPGGSTTRCRALRRTARRAWRPWHWRTARWARKAPRRLTTGGWRVQCGLPQKMSCGRWKHVHLDLKMVMQIVDNIVKYKGIMIEYPEYPVRICKNHTWLGIPEPNEGFNGNIYIIIIN